MRILKRRLKQFILLLKIYISKILSFFCYKKREKELWLILERGEDARDNGFVFFQYLKKYKKDIDVRYIINYNSSDYNKLKDYNETIDYGSFKHYILLNQATLIISSHILTYIPHYQLLIKFINLGLIRYKAKIVFLQHGITQAYLPQLCFPNAKIDIFICGAALEYEYVSNNFNHPNGVVQYTGLARFDNLHDVHLKKQILLMPTWRSYLSDNKKDEFINSSYYLSYSSLLCNEDIVNMLRKYDYVLIFYPHFEMQKFIGAFNANSEHIIIADFNTYDVQTLLKESSVLITDYSSVFFDFAYMYKPIIYYQFDREDFINKHYAEGYFDYKTMGFGDVTFSEQEIVESLSRILDNKCLMQDKYKERIKDFFVLHDRANCQRIYTKIIEMKTNHEI